MLFRLIYRLTLWTRVVSDLPIFVHPAACKSLTGVSEECPELICIFLGILLIPRYIIAEPILWNDACILAHACGMSHPKGPQTAIVHLL